MLFLVWCSRNVLQTVTLQLTLDQHDGKYIMTDFSFLVELLLAKEYYKSVCPPSYYSSATIYYCEIIFTSQGSYQREKFKK